MNPSRQYLPPQNVIDAHSNIVHYCKNGLFSDAERTFQKMCEMIKFQPIPVDIHFDETDNDNDNDDDDEYDELGWSDSNQRKRIYSDIQIKSFQKSISTMVRYAPTIQDALDYACFCLQQVPEPLRNESLEKIMTINLIYLYKRQGGRDNLTKALELIKTGVALGYALPSEPSNTFTSNSDAVFADVSNSTLRYFRLNLSQDKKSLI